MVRKEPVKNLPEVHYPTDASDQEPRYYVWEYWGTDAAEAMVSPEYEEFGYTIIAAIECGGLCPSGWEIPDFYTWKELLACMPTSQSLNQLRTFTSKVCWMVGMNGI